MPANVQADVSVPREVQPWCYGTEVEKFHTRLLRVSLALEESRSYWDQLQPETPKLGRADIAFAGRWFGSKSSARVKRLLAEFGHRYDAYPAALAVLLAWQPSDPSVRQNICHWHLQLSDPMYRAFSADFLEQRRSQSVAATIDRDSVARWVSHNLEAEWASATVLRMATALITCATAAGLCKQASRQRVLLYPQVTDVALAYWLYFLRGLRFEGSLLSNPYFASVGLSDRGLEERLAHLPGLRFSRMGDVYEFDWRYDGLQAWAAGELTLRDSLALQNSLAERTKQVSV